MLRIVRSQDIQALADDLAKHINYQSDPFSSTPIVVRSLALGDWLENYLAKKNGICAQAPRHFLGELQWQWIEQITQKHSFNPKPPLSMSGVHWQLFAWLYSHTPAIVCDSTHPLQPLLSVLFEGKIQLTHNKSYAMRLWTFSEQFARIFMRYIALRPQWLETWHNNQSLDIEKLIAQKEYAGQMPQWLKQHYHQLQDAQRYLWQQILDSPYQARQQRLAQFWHQLQTHPQTHTQLPKKLIVFILHALTPESLQFLAQLSECIETTLYHHTPTLDYIDDIVDAKWLQRYQIQNPQKTEQQHFDAGQHLVSRFGKQARDQAKLLTQLSQQIPPSKLIQEELDHSRAGHNLLTYLQQDLHNLDDTTPSRSYFKMLIEDSTQKQDDSLRVHACYGLLRQLEVLRGELIQWLNADPTRQLSDILIVLPEIGDLQGTIEAVFPPDGHYDGYILPARLTGLTKADTQKLWRALTGHLTLIHSGFYAPDVIDWLLLEENAHAYHLTSEQQQRAAQLLQQAGYHRGFNAAHIQQTLNPDDKDVRFTYSYALNRLWTGLLIPNTAHPDIAPMPDLSLDDLPIIQALAQIAQTIEHLYHWQQHSHSADDWLNGIETLLTQTYSPLSEQPAWLAVKHSLNDLRYQLHAQNTLLSQQSTALPLEFFLTYLSDKLADNQVSSEPSGVITIGRLSALRHLPYKLIVFLNANLDDFPNNTQDNRYDLTQLDQRQSGDQLKEDDDYGAFLDCLLNAKEACWFFYNHLTPTDPHPQLPSTVLQELLDYLAADCKNPEQAIKTFIIQHSQNPFDADSLSQQAPLWYNIHQALQHPAKSPTPLISLTNPSTDPRKVEHNDTLALTQFHYQLTHPATLYAQAHQLNFLDQANLTQALEPLSSDGLNRYQLWDYFIANTHQNRLADSQTLRSLPILPAGAYGTLWFKQQHQQYQQQLQHLLTSTQSAQLTPTQSTSIATTGATFITSLPSPEHNHPWLRYIPAKRVINTCSKLGWNIFFGKSNAPPTPQRLQSLSFTTNASPSSP